MVRQAEGSDYLIGIPVTGKLYRWLPFPGQHMGGRIAAGMIPMDQGRFLSHKFLAFATLVDIPYVS